RAANSHDEWHAETVAVASHETLFARRWHSDEQAMRAAGANEVADGPFLFGLEIAVRLPARTRFGYRAANFSLADASTSGVAPSRYGRSPCAAHSAIKLSNRSAPATCRLAIFMTDQTSMPSVSRTSDSSLAKATLTSRKAFSTSFDSSATRAVVSRIGPTRKDPYSSLARPALRRSSPPRTRALSVSSRSV